ncbi:MAG: glycosyltransferase family 2 protein [Candidatus Woesearchaeota archaeon]|jgi:glycosyltransferase involved in cell wall biosynthesis|nr:glycosyltransferase family 2 protein [Candidatus Woesearchaeota archaeon]
MKQSKILIAMPAYNEAKVIFDVIKDIKKEGYKNILVIDDCSKDDTFNVAKKAGATVLKHVVNRGAGAATNTGLIYAKRNNYDYIVFIDSDGQHSPKEIKKLILHANKYDVVIGSRMVGSLKNMPFQRRAVNFAGSFITYLIFGLFVRDSQSGFKVFSRNAINKINISFDRYEFCSEIIGEIYKNKLSYKEIPIKIIYSTHSLGKIDSGQSVFNGFKMILRFIFRL